MTPPVATAAGTRVLPRTAAPRAPRRVSGPARRGRRGEDARRDRATGTARRAVAHRDPFAVRALERAQRMSDSRFLDRLIRGRLWIPLVAAGLMGIVFMQVSMLKLNAGIGRAVTSAGTLERQNAAMRADVSRMESGSRIDSVAHGLGMVVPADGSTTYVKATGARQAGAAATKMTPADPNAIARAKAGTALAQGQAAGTTTTGSATAAPAPVQAQAQAAAGTTTPPVTPTTPTASTATGAATTAGTTGTTASAPPAAATQPAAATTTGAATAPTQQQQAPAPAAVAPTPSTTTSGGAVAPTPQG